MVAEPRRWALCWEIWGEDVFFFNGFFMFFFRKKKTFESESISILHFFGGI